MVILSAALTMRFLPQQALLALKQLDSKKHSSVISLFNRHYVKTGIVDRTIGRELNKTRLRESSDYADFYLVDKKEAVNQFEKPLRFIVMQLRIYFREQ